MTALPALNFQTSDNTAISLRVTAEKALKSKSPTTDTEAK